MNSDAEYVLTAVGDKIYTTLRENEYFRVEASTVQVVVECFVLVSKTALTLKVTFALGNAAIKARFRVIFKLENKRSLELNKLL